MATTNFQDFNQNNPVTAAWLNDINGGVYTTGGVAKKASQSAAAWARFSATGGVVTIQQSSNIATIVRTGVGVYLVTYASALTNATNSYGMSLGQAGFAFASAETTGSVTVSTVNSAGVPIDPSLVSLQVFGNN